ncbi:purine-nucleoside phosphorylase [Bacillota bacterium LX-D]|nr:purine-nucleoside phosphorylase [Bacillota bacterium LX-D]
MHTLKRNLDNSLKVINNVIKGFTPKVGLILGSGLGILAEEINEPQKISYRDIPHFPVSTVEGHTGQLVFGKLNNVPVITCQGRIHYYEGYSAVEITYPVRIMQQLGVEYLIVTNAAGGVNLAFEPGDLMLITDHINLTGENPLRGQNNPDLGLRFPDMSEAYFLELQQKALNVAAKLKIELKQGVYAGVIGPSFETPAEIRYLRTIGADAVGMSTVPEVIVANHAGIKVLGLSCITNMAAGILKRKLTHEEVMETAEKIKKDFAELVKEIVADLK